MNFREGDPVMHWTYGLGNIIQLEERTISGSKALYYAVQIRDLTVWVPADGNVGSRLRSPTPRNRFKQMLAVLSAPSEPLPADRLERRACLQELLKDGRPEALCQIIRDLSAYQKKKVHPMNDNDQMVLKQSRNTLLGEWGFVLSITPAQAEHELRHLLATQSLEIEK